jgi:hypothetical protein
MFFSIFSDFQITSDIVTIARPGKPQPARTFNVHIMHPSFFFYSGAHIMMEL